VPEVIMKNILIFLFILSSFNIVRASESKSISMILKNKILKSHDLYNLNGSQLRIIRNSIYAKYNYKFKSKTLLKYFSKFSWYNPNKKNVDGELTLFDKKNIKLLQFIENILTSKEWSYIDSEGLSDKDIQAVQNIIDAIKNKNK